MITQIYGMTETRNDAETVFDAVVVGGSWAGLSATMQIARGRRRVCVVDSGQPRNRFSSNSHGFYTRDGETTSRLPMIGKEQLRHYPNAKFIEGKIESALLESTGFKVTIANESRIATERVVVAVGVHDLLPSIDGIASPWGHGVNHCPYCHGYERSGRPWCVLINSSLPDQSVYQSLLLREWSDRVTAFTDGKVSEFRDSERQLFASAGIAIEDRLIAGIEGPDRVVETVRLNDGESVHIDALFLVSSHNINGDLHKQLDCSVKAGPFGDMIAIDAKGETSVPGVFTAGDVARP